MALTIQQIQARITAGYDQRDIINLLADYIEANPGGGALGYNVYTALFGQTGTNNPSVTELENTTDISAGWVRSTGGGLIVYVLNTPYTDINKIYIPPFGNNSGNGNPVISLFNAGSGQLVGFYHLYPAMNTTIDIILEIWDLANNIIDWSTLMGTTKLYLPEIRVYQ